MKICIVTSHAESIFWFRFDFINELISRGYDVIVVGPSINSETMAKFKDNTLKYIEYSVVRNGKNPFRDILTLISLIKIMRLEKPDSLFLYNAKAVVYGNIASLFIRKIKVYSLIAGLGSLIRSEKKLNFTKLILSIQYWVVGLISTKVFCHNNDDKKYLNKHIKISDKKLFVFAGSGVDIKKFYYTTIPSNEFTFLFIGRLLLDKGLKEYLLACEKLKMEYPMIKCIVVGDFDTNPTSIKKDEFDKFINNGTIEYYGYSSNVDKYYRMCNVFVLPSYHEGRPKTILEAMSSGRAIITTDAPGCRETIINNEHGYIVKTRDVNDLLRAMRKMVENPSQTKIMGDNCRQWAVNNYDVNIVNSKMIKEMSRK